MALANEGKGSKRCYSLVPGHYKPEVGWELFRFL